VPVLGDSRGIPVTVMLDSWFGIHPHIVRSGLWAKMKPSEQNLYIHLMERSEFFCSREFQVKDCDLKASVGVSPRAACNARKKLQEYGLIQYKAGLGNRYTYTICDPKTKQPYPGDPKTPIRMPKASRSTSEVTAAQECALSRRQEPTKEAATPESYGVPLRFDS
jgi:hypothetical protein